MATERIAPTPLTRIPGSAQTPSLRVGRYLSSLPSRGDEELKVTPDRLPVTLTGLWGHRAEGG